MISYKMSNSAEKRKSKKRWKINHHVISPTMWIKVNRFEETKDKSLIKLKIKWKLKIKLRMNDTKKNKIYKIMIVVFYYQYQRILCEKDVWWT